jgi:hypothetical protein
MSRPRAGAPEDRRLDSQPSPQEGIVPAHVTSGHSHGVAVRPAGYRMIETFEAENFRCFESLKLGSLKRVNIITGENASGKSALLEALFSGSRGTPEGLLFLNQFRGIVVGQSLPGFPLAINPLQFPALWGHWFLSSKRNGATTTATKIAFRFSDSDSNRYSCDFNYDPDRISQTPQVATAISSGVIPLVTQRQMFPAGQQQPIQTNNATTLNAQGQLQALPPLPNLGPVIFIFTAALNYAEVDNVMWFSQLRERGETAEIVAFFKKYFPFIYNLEVLQPTAGAASAIYATLSSGQARRLQLLSSGIYKIMTILLACAHSRRGVVLIDEIENGIFYDKYELTWSILNKFSKDYECQLFVTSHSLECMQKLVPIIGDNDNDFSLIQTTRENGTCAVRHVGGTAMKAALAGGNDVRGGNGKWGSLH